jgi:hypothetical protein
MADVIMIAIDSHMIRRGFLSFSASWDSWLRHYILLALLLAITPYLRFRHITELSPLMPLRDYAIILILFSLIRYWLRYY